MWKRFAKNKPTVTRSDTDVGPIVGAKGQAKPFMGFLSSAIFRDAAKNGYGMGICAGLKPWVGQLTPRVAVIHVVPRPTMVAMISVTRVMMISRTGGAHS